MGGRGRILQGTAMALLTVAMGTGSAGAEVVGLEVYERYLEPAAMTAEPERAAPRTDGVFVQSKETDSRFKTLYDRYFGEDKDKDKETKRTDRDGDGEFESQKRADAEPKPKSEGAKEWADPEKRALYIRIGISDVPRSAAEGAEGKEREIPGSGKKHVRRTPDALDELYRRYGIIEDEKDEAEKPEVEGPRAKERAELVATPARVEPPSMPVLVRLGPGETPGELPPGFIYDPKQLAELAERLRETEKELEYWREIDRRGQALTGKESGAPVAIEGDSFYSKIKLYDFDGFSIAVLRDAKGTVRAFSFALAPKGYQPWDQMTFFFPESAIRPMISMLERARARYQDYASGSRLGSMLRKTELGNVGLEIFKSDRAGKVLLSEHCRVRGGDQMEFHRILQREAGLKSDEIVPNLKRYAKVMKDDPAFAGKFYGIVPQQGTARMEFDANRLGDMARALKRFVGGPEMPIRRTGIPSEYRRIGRAGGTGTRAASDR